MNNLEQVKSGEDPIEEAFRVMDQIFKDSRPSIPETKGLQHIRNLKDGTKMIMARYLQRQDVGPTGENDIISVDISNLHNSFGISFIITENGLVDISFYNGSTGMVSLRSHLYPRPNENLQVAYEGSKSQRPLVAFRNASKLIVGWVKEMVDKDSFSPCPVTITEKTNPKA